MDLKQTTAGYIDIEDNDLAQVTGMAAVAQDIKGSIRVFKREYFRDQSIGIDYMNEIFQKGTSLQVIATRFKSEILNVPGVLEINDFQLTTLNRVLMITAEIVSEDGTFPYTLEV